MRHHETSESIMEKFFSAVLESCCKVVILPLCEDNIRRLRDRLKSQQELIMRSTDFSKREVFIWMKKMGNLKKRSENFLATHESRAGFCSFLCSPFDNYIAATLLENWEKLDEEEPSGMFPSDSTAAPLSRKSTAPTGAIEAELSLYNQPTENGDEGDMNYGSNNCLVLDSLSFRRESDQVARDLLSTLRLAPGYGGTALMQGGHENRLGRAKSFDIIHDERWIVLDRRFL